MTKSKLYPYLTEEELKEEFERQAKEIKDFDEGYSG